MKMIQILILVIFAGSFSYAEEVDRAAEDFTNKSFELLISKIDTLELVGQTEPDQKLKPVIEDLGDFLSNILFSAMSMGSEPDEEYKGSIHNFQAKCENLQSAKDLSACRLVINYKDKGDSVITFIVRHQNTVPTEILNNRVTITQ